jgi:hypothetical protein
MAEPMLRPSASTSAGAAPPPEPVIATHGCVRCGAPVPIDVALCERCNPLGLAQPSASQVHGTAVAGVILAVVLLAVLARVSVAGVGPFAARFVGAAPDEAGLTVSVAVTNGGTKAGATSCRVTDPDLRFGGPSALILSPEVPAGQSVTFTGIVTVFGKSPKPLDVDCSAP